MLQLHYYMYDGKISIYSSSSLKKNHIKYYVNILFTLVQYRKYRKLMLLR